MPKVASVTVATTAVAVEEPAYRTRHLRIYKVVVEVKDEQRSQLSPLFLQGACPRVVLYAWHEAYNLLQPR
jgi:hypothetical protein